MADQAKAIAGIPGQYDAVGNMLEPPMVFVLTEKGRVFMGSTDGVWSEVTYGLDQMIGATDPEEEGQDG